MLEKMCKNLSVVLEKELEKYELDVYYHNYILNHERVSILLKQLLDLRSHVKGIREWEKKNHRFWLNNNKKIFKRRMDEIGIYNNPEFDGIVLITWILYEDGTYEFEVKIEI